MSSTACGFDQEQIAPPNNRWLGYGVGIPAAPTAGWAVESGQHDAIFVGEARVVLTIVPVVAGQRLPVAGAAAKVRVIAVLSRIPIRKRFCVYCKFNILMML